MRLSARIGAIQMDEDGVHAALVKTGGRKPVVLKYAYAPIPETPPDMTPEEVRAEAIARATAGLRTQAEAWMLSIDSAWCVARRIEVPFKGRRVAAAVPFELEPHLAFPIEDVAVDFAVAEENAGATTVLAVGLRRSIIEEQLSACQLAGLTIAGVGLDVIGLTALHEAVAGASRGPQVLLHVRRDNAALVAIEKGRLRKLDILSITRRDFETRPADAWRTVGNALRVLDLAPDAENADAAALQLRVHGFESGEDGEFALADNVEVVFSKHLLPKTPGGARESDARDVLAGVALCGAGGGYAMNFLDARLAAGQRPEGLGWRAALAVGLCLLLAAAFVTSRFMEYRNDVALTEALGEEVWAVYAETFPDRDDAGVRPGGDIAGFKSFELMRAAAAEEEEAQAAFSPEVFKRPTLLDVLMELASRVPSKAVTFTDMKISTGRNTELTLYGEANTPQVLNQMLEQLRASQMFELDERRLRRSSSRGHETFELVARF